VKTFQLEAVKCIGRHTDRTVTSDASFLSLRNGSQLKIKIKINGVIKFIEWNWLEVLLTGKNLILVQ
jgi:hypothetical protein